MQHDQFAARYAIKLGSSVIVAACNIVIQFLLPRAISIEEYGFYSYNLNVFSSVIVMSNLSASSALVAKYSKHQKDIGYVTFYLKFYGIVALVLTLALIGIYTFESMRESFGGQTLFSIMLGLEAAALLKFLADVISIYDTAAIARFPAVMQIIQRVFLCIFLIATYLLGYLNLVVFYFGQVSILLIVIGVLLWVFFEDYRMSRVECVERSTHVYFREYYEFCKPLVVAGMVSQGIVIFMNYALMRYSGPVEQAMFGVAWQLNTLVGYVFSPYAELMKREFSIIVYIQEQLRQKLLQSTKIIIWLSSYFAIFIAVYAQKLLSLLYGNKYADAVVATQMIMMYTISQAMGQLYGSFLIAKEDTKGYAMLSIVGQVVSVVSIFLFQVPNFIFKSGLGSTGIGLTYTCAGYISVLVMMGYIAKESGASFIKMFWSFVVTMGSCILVSQTTRLLTEAIFFDGMLKDIFCVTIGGLLYTFILAAEIYSFPDLIATKRVTIQQVIGKVIARWGEK